MTGEAWADTAPSRRGAPDNPPIATALPTASRLAAASQIVLLLALWVITHPYVGLVHDARLYAIQALNALEPGRFGADLFFKYGSQDQFTLFTPLYKNVVGLIGMAAATLLSEVVGQALWLGGLVVLLRAILRRRREWLLAAAAVVLFYPGYGGMDTFAYGEIFPTPRLFAEGLCMLGLGLALRGRRVAGWPPLLAAAAIHPLMALGPIGVVVFHAALSDRRVWLAIAAGLAAALAMTWLGVGPFGRALQQFNGEWLRVVLRRCDFAFLMEWRWWELAQVAASVAVLAVAHRLGDGRERRMILALGAVTGLGLAATLVGSDVLHNVLITNLQPWRILWLTAVSSNALLAVVILRAPADRFSRNLFLVVALALAATRVFVGIGLVGNVMALIACAVFAMEEVRGRALPPAPRLIAVALFSVAAGLILVIVYFSAKVSPHLLWWLFELTAAFAAAGLLIGVILRRARRAALAVAAGLLVVGLAGADRIDPWQAYVFSPPRDDGLRAFLAGAGTTYWEGELGLELLWFRVGAPNYYSCLQGTGAMFYSGTAADYDRRGRILRTLNTRDFADDEKGMCESKIRPKAFGPTSRAQLAIACRALPDLDTFILDRPVPGAAARVWRAPAAQAYYESTGAVTKVATFYRYSCADLRRGGGPG
ncbi:MAG TPA: hypothetical protein VGH15_01295 [Caulobacteraceae bacterium]